MKPTKQFRQPRCKEHLVLWQKCDDRRKRDSRKESTVWFQAVIRGDANRIEIGARTNIQDGTIIHVDHDAPTIGRRCDCWVSVALHGCTI